jgi:3-oxoacyl-(acyl-carrier-protein) synthase
VTPWITRVDAWTPAGRGLAPLAAAITRGQPLAREVWYDAPGLRSPFAALCGPRRAVELLDEVVAAVAPPEGAGLVVGTSSGAISHDFEAWHRGGGVEQRWRQLPTQAVGARLGLSPRTTVSVACASGAVAFEVARGWLRDGRCERVVVAGVDVLSAYVHAGFAGLGALASDRSRPFTVDRDGLVLGDGAAAFLLETPASARRAGRAPLTSLLGCGLSQDGVHLTAPDRTGAGLERAIRAALRDAAVGAGDIGTVSAHATGTAFNDAMEAQAYGRVFDDGAPVHVAKPVVGHSLGAAGAIEAAAMLAYLLGADVPPELPAPAPDCPGRFRPARDPRFGLSVSAAFGGVDAAIVFGPGEGATFRRRGVEAGPTATIAADELPLATILPGLPASLGRADTYVRAGIAGLAALRDHLDADTAVVLASEAGCRQADLRSHESLISRGPAGASRLHFAYTTPGSALAEAAIALGLRGPALVLCDDAAAGRREASRLVAHGVADRAVALHVEAAEGPACAVASLYRVSA